MAPILFLAMLVAWYFNFRGYWHGKPNPTGRETRMGETKQTKLKKLFR